MANIYKKTTTRLSEVKDNLMYRKYQSMTPEQFVAYLGATSSETEIESAYNYLAQQASSEFVDRVSILTEELSSSADAGLEDKISDDSDPFE